MLNLKIGSESLWYVWYTLVSLLPFKKSNVERILELGSGQGRDTLFFARSGFNIEALDYSSSAVKECI